jgi:hypothetical protein
VVTLPGRGGARWVKGGFETGTVHCVAVVSCGGGLVAVSSWGGGKASLLSRVGDRVVNSEMGWAGEMCSCGSCGRARGMVEEDAVGGGAGGSEGEGMVLKRLSCEVMDAVAVAVSVEGSWCRDVGSALMLSGRGGAREVCVMVEAGMVPIVAVLCWGGDRLVVWLGELC